MPHALVTGTSSGFGLATASRLIGLGWEVTGTRRGGSAGAGTRFPTLQLDLRDQRSIERVAEAVNQIAGGLDALVSNAGFGLVAPIEETSAAEFADQVAVNLIGTMQLCRACLPALRRARGIIVQISSTGGRFASSGFGAYNASKFGLEGASDALAGEVEGQGVRLTIIEPGPFRTSIAPNSVPVEGRGASGLYDELWPEIDASVAYLADAAEDPEIAVDAIVAAAVVPGAPRRIAVGEGASDQIREHARAILAEMDQGDEFLRSQAHRARVPDA